MRLTAAFTNLAGAGGGTAGLALTVFNLAAGALTAFFKATLGLAVLFFLGVAALFLTVRVFALDDSFLISDFISFWTRSGKLCSN